MRIYGFTDPKIKQQNDNFFGDLQTAFEVCENSSFKTSNNSHYNSNGIIKNMATVNSI